MAANKFMLLSKIRKTCVPMKNVRKSRLYCFLKIFSTAGTDLVLRSNFPLKMLWSTFYQNITNLNCWRHTACIRPLYPVFSRLSKFLRRRLRPHVFGTCLPYFSFSSNFNSKPTTTVFFRSFPNKMKRNFLRQIYGTHQFQRFLRRICGKLN